MKTGYLVSLRSEFDKMAGSCWTSEYLHGRDKTIILKSGDTPWLIASGIFEICCSLPAEPDIVQPRDPSHYHSSADRDSTLNLIKYELLELRGRIDRGNQGAQCLLRSKECLEPYKLKSADAHAE
jgi:hypothetical protein